MNESTDLILSINPSWNQSFSSFKKTYFLLLFCFLLIFVFLNSLFSFKLRMNCRENVYELHIQLVWFSLWIQSFIRSFVWFHLNEEIMYKSKSMFKSNQLFLIQPDVHCTIIESLIWSEESWNFFFFLIIIVFVCSQHWNGNRDGFQIWFVCI